MRDPIAYARRLLEVCASLEADGKPDTASALRREKTARDPLLFALVYLTRHLTNTAGVVTLSDVHRSWAETAKGWIKAQTEPSADRRAEVAPREMGKSTWWFLVLPMWAAAHGHVGFAAAFADTEAQAQTHLATFKAELDANRLIREDYADLVEPKTRGRGTVMADRVSLYHARSGFVFAAAGMDSSNLGMKVGDRRPDLIILDDIEPHAGRYSADLAKKRLATLREAILPLNIYAHVIVVGTVTMVGSIVHQIVKRARGDYVHDDPDEVTNWVEEERIVARHWLPIVDADGERVSVWPAKWPIDYLLSIEHTAGYAKNYANDPLGADGDYWTIEDFRRLPYTPELAAAITYEVVSVDPAVTTKDSSDFTSIANVGWVSPRFTTDKRHAGKVAVLSCRSIKAGGDGVRTAVIRAIEAAAERGHAVIVIVEVNQGGDLWRRILHDLPCKVKTFSSSAPKPVRAADALDHYQRGRVAHAPGLRDAEGQMTGFPNAPHDDDVDSIGAGVRYFLSRDKKRATKPGAESTPYA